MDSHEEIMGLRLLRISFLRSCRQDDRLEAMLTLSRIVPIAQDAPISERSSHSPRKTDHLSFTKSTLAATAQVLSWTQTSIVRLA